MALAYHPLRDSITQGNSVLQNTSTAERKIADLNHLGIAPVPLGLVGSEVPITQGGAGIEPVGLVSKTNAQPLSKFVVSDIGLEPTIFWERQTLCH
jgi:hypothetical protein